MGENICKESDQKGINLQNIKNVCSSVSNNTVKKQAEDLNRYLFNYIYNAKKNMK